MGFIKESFRDWKYYASKENTGANRGFFRTMAIGFIVLAVLAVVLFVAAIAGVLTGALKIVGFVFPVIVIVLLALFLFVTRDK